MKRSLIVLMLGGFFYALIFACIFSSARAVICKANELKEMGNGYLSFFEEDQTADDKLLSDTFKFISEVDNDEDINTSTNEEDYSYSTDDEIVDEDNTMTEFQVMVIFGFGLTAGVIVGHFLTGFIK